MLFVFHSFYSIYSDYSSYNIHVMNTEKELGRPERSALINKYMCGKIT